MDGKLGDLYLYYMMAWNSYMEWAQAFKNYLVRLTDTEVMVKEYAFEDVLKSQTAEGSTKAARQLPKSIHAVCLTLSNAPMKLRYRSTGRHHFHQYEDIHHALLL